jgi:uncharacterized protein involved in outer membrane biogenesis
MRRPLPIVLFALAATLVGMAVFVVLFDWSIARGPIERAFEVRTGRTLSIRGPLELSFWPPRLIAHDVTISNPSWARRPNLLEARQISIIPSLRALLAGRVRIRELGLVEPVVSLEVRDHERSWTQGTPTEGSVLMVVDRLLAHRGRIEYLEAERDTAVTAELDSGGKPGEDHFSVRAEGRYRGETFDLAASGPSLLPLGAGTTPFAVDARLQAGRTRLEASGVLAGLPTPNAVDMKISLVGDDLSTLRRLFDLNAPPTPPYRIQGRLRRDQTGWRLDDARGRIGDSDVAGWVALARGPRPLLTASIVSDGLDFDDLGPLVGAPPRTARGESASPEQRRDARRMENADRALPSKPFDAGPLRRMDVDVTLEGKRVHHPPALPIESLSARLRITHGKIRLDPLRMQMAGGEITGTVELDARANPLRGQTTLDLHGLRLARLFPTVDAMKRAKGLAHGRLMLAGRGNSIAELLANAEGRVSLAVDQGRISNLVLELIGLDAGESALLLATGDRDVSLRCAVVDLTVQQGIGTSQVLVVDTDDTLVVGAGAVSFARERLDLTLYPQPKDQSILAARTPLHVRGSFRNPQIAPDASSLAARGASATLLGMVNPLLALASFVEPGPGKDSDCANLISRSQAWRNKPSPVENR